MKNVVIVLLIFFYNITSENTFAFEKGSEQIMSSASEIRNNLQKTVSFLAGEVGSRGYLQTDALRKTTEYIKLVLSSYGYEVHTQSYTVKDIDYENIWAEKTGIKSPEKIIVIGAHYDTVTGTPGADDNASGVAALLELARLLQHKDTNKTIHLVAFTLEEPPFFRSRNMGSYVYAKTLKEDGKDVEGMICLESVGYFTDTPDSQMLPLPLFKLFYPSKGNFITFVSNFSSGSFMQKAKKAFIKGTALPVETISMFSVVPGIDFSDHRSFWKFGYNAFMVTDTAFYRNPNYHGAGDVPDTLDYERMTEVVTGLDAVIKTLSQD